MDAAETSDVYELGVERHRRRSIIAVSNREPPEWLATMADPLLAQGRWTAWSTVPTNSCSMARATGAGRSSERERLGEPDPPRPGSSTARGYRSAVAMLG